MKRPYTPSWANHFVNWLNRLPIPMWVIFILIYLVSVLSYHVAYWLDGAVPFGTPVGILLFNGIWSVIGIAFLSTLDHIANRAIDRFAILVPRKRAQLEDIRYQMTNVPALPALVLTLIICGVVILGTFFDASLLGVKETVPKLLFMPVYMFSYSFAPIMLFHGFRQLNLVIKAFRLVNEINLFHLQPLYAFSSLTMTSSLFWLLILNLNFISNFMGGLPSGVDVLLALTFSLPYVVLAFITFIVPLWGMHVRIQNKKVTSLEENGLQIEKAHQILYVHLNEKDFKKSGDMEKSLSSLYRMREEIQKVPTWPWNPGTLRGFLSAVFLPLGLWIAQQVLARFL